MSAVVALHDVRRRRSRTPVVLVVDDGQDGEDGGDGELTRHVERHVGAGWVVARASSANAAAVARRLRPRVVMMPLLAAGGDGPLAEFIADPRLATISRVLLTPDQSEFFARFAFSLGASATLRVPTTIRLDEPRPATVELR